VKSVSEPLHRALGLTDTELESIRGVLKREPNSLELALYGVMWSEHCSYKSSRMHLRRLPSEGPHVLVGPGENAGVIDAGDGSPSRSASRVTTILPRSSPTRERRRGWAASFVTCSRWAHAPSR